MSVSELLRNTARRFPDKTAIHFDNHLVTYKSLDQCVDNLARGCSTWVLSGRRWLVYFWATVRILSTLTLPLSGREGWLFL